MTDSLEQRIIQHLARERGMRADRIGRDSRLLQNLGMDGDDAVEFFQAFGAVFDVELDDLYENWDSHFAPEAGGPGLFAGVLSVVVVAGIVMLVGRVLVLPDWPLIASGLALWFVLWFLWPFGRKFAPITVDDLVRAAEAGKWDKPAPGRPDARG